MKNYIEYRGLYFAEGTEKRVMDVLTNNVNSQKRIRVFYGTNDKYWLEEYDTIGTIGKSCGKMPIPLLIKNKRSFGGTGILTDCIQLITIDKTVVYGNPAFKIGKFEIKTPVNETLIQEGYTSCVYYDGDNVANFKNEESAERYVNFMKGLSNRK